MYSLLNNFPTSYSGRLRPSSVASAAPNTSGDFLARFEQIMQQISLQQIMMAANSDSLINRLEILDKAPIQGLDRVQNPAKTNEATTVEQFCDGVGKPLQEQAKLLDDLVNLFKQHKEQLSQGQEQLSKKDQAISELQQKNSELRKELHEMLTEQKTKGGGAPPAHASSTHSKKTKKETNSKAKTDLPASTESNPPSAELKESQQKDDLIRKLALAKQEHHSDAIKIQQLTASQAKLVQELETLKQELRNTQQQKKQLDQKLTAAATQDKESQAKIQKVQKDIAAFEQKMANDEAQSKKKIAALEQKMANDEAQSEETIAAHKNTVNETQQALQKALEDRTKLEERLTARNEEFSTLLTKTDDLRQQLGKTQAELDETQAELGKTQAELGNTQAELEQKSIALNNVTSSYNHPRQGQFTHLMGERNHFAERLSYLQQSNGLLQQALNKAREDCASLHAAFNLKLQDNNNLVTELNTLRTALNLAPPAQASGVNYQQQDGNVAPGTAPKPKRRVNNPYPDWQRR